MNGEVPAELRFLDDGTVAYGVLAESNEHTVTVRLAEQLSCDAFLYGRAVMIVYPGPEGLIFAPCRLVANHDGGMWRDVVAVLTEEPAMSDRRDRPRISCRLDALYRPAGGPQSAEGWMEATITNINRYGAGLLIRDWPEFPGTVEMQVMVPEALAGSRKTETRPIRLRADRRYRRHRGENTVIGLQFKTPTATAERRLEGLIEFLTSQEAARRSTPIKTRLRWRLDDDPYAGSDGDWLAEAAAGD